MLFQTIHDIALMMDRECLGHEASPSGSVLDSQTVKAPAPGAKRGYDAAKKTVNRKRHQSGRHFELLDFAEFRLRGHILQRRTKHRIATSIVGVHALAWRYRFAPAH